jgi:hypothetical protein
MDVPVDKCPHKTPLAGKGPSGLNWRTATRRTAAMPRSRSRSICSFAGELARPSLAVEPGTTEARIFTVSRYMSRVFEEAAVVTWAVP